MNRRKTSRAILALEGLSVAALIAFAVIPLVLVLRSAFTGGGAPLFAELSAAESHAAILHTIALSLAVVAVAVPIGTALAWLIERTDLFTNDRLRALATAVLALPVAIPPYLLGIAWVLLANGRNGLLNRSAVGTWIDLYGLDGIVLVLSTSAYPFALLGVRAALERADPSLEEAARISGAGITRVLRDVTLPLALPAIAASAGLVFVFSAAAFAVPYLMGSSAQPPVMVLTTRIYQQTTLGGAEMMQRASALALVLLATAVSAQAIAGAIARQRSIVQVTGKASRPSPLGLGPARAPIAIAVALFAAIFVILPIATIAWTSLQRTFADPLVLTTAHWSAVLARAETLRAFSHSVVLALAAGAIVCALGFVLSRASKRGRTGEHLSTLASAPYAVPGTVLAIGLILTFSREIRVIVLERLTLILHLHGTLFMLLAAYAVKYLAFGVRASRAALDQLHPSLEEAARTSGAGPMRSTRDVVLPLVSPAIGAAFVLTALTCLSELTMSVLLFGPGTETAGTLLFELQSYGDPPAAAVVACVIVVLVIAGDAIARRLERAARSRTR